MPKHNIDAIAAATLAAQAAYDHINSPVEPADPLLPASLVEQLPAQRIRVLEAIHGSERKEIAGGTEAERRADRLFYAIVKALTVRL